MDKKNSVALAIAASIEYGLREIKRDEKAIVHELNTNFNPDTAATFWAGEVEKRKKSEPTTGQKILMLELEAMVSEFNALKKDPAALASYAGSGRRAQPQTVYLGQQDPSGVRMIPYEAAKRPADRRALIAPGMSHLVPGKASA